VCLRCERKITVFNSRNMLCPVCRMENYRKYHRAYEKDKYWKDGAFRESKKAYAREHKKVRI